MRVAALLLTAALLVAASAVHAEVIELEGTVKSVDPDARTISIERKTAKGTKTLDLEVNKKAGDLSAVKVGDKISFSYDPDLELVTQIGGASSEDGTRIPKDLQGVWIAVRVDRHGTMMTPKDLQEQARRIIIQGDTLTFEETKDGRVVKFGGTITVDPKNKTLDLIGKGPNGADIRLLCIYEVTDEELKLCSRRNADGKAKRPTAFKATPESPNESISYTCKRLRLQ